MASRSDLVEKALAHLSSKNAISAARKLLHEISCERCYNSLDTRKRLRDPRSDGTPAELSELGSCVICNAIRDALRQILGDEAFSLGSIALSPGLLEYSEIYDEWSFELKAFPYDTVLALYFTVSEESPQQVCPLAQSRTLRLPGSICTAEPLEIRLHKASKWLKTCLGTHSACSAHQGKFVPPRLLALSMLGNAFTADIKLVHTLDSDEHYKFACLSHCWGTHQPLRLLKDNIKDLSSLISWNELTPTFQDAILTCRIMGIHFLWIDSLCIIQDDRSDWLQHVENMGLIYRSGILTIAASRSRNGQAGFLQPSRMTLASQGRQVKIGPAPIERTSVITMGQWSRFPSNVLPLVSRAWAYQERILSSRFLAFGVGEYSWDCYETFSTESASARHPPDTVRYLEKSRITGIGNASQDSFNYLWETMLEDEYTTTDLTHNSDRLLALGGILKLLASQRGEPCFAGHFNLPVSLGWKMKRRPQRIQPKIAPSWSWASMEHGLPERDSTALSPSAFGWVMRDSGPSPPGWVEAKCIRVDCPDIGLLETTTHTGEICIETLTASGSFVPTKNSFQILGQQSDCGFIFHVPDSHLLKGEVWPDVDIVNSSLPVALTCACVDQVDCDGLEFGVAMILLQAESDNSERYVRFGALRMHFRGLHSGASIRSFQKSLIKKQLVIV